MFVVYTSELMRRVGQIWRLWSEELKPKWSAFTPTGGFKRIIWQWLVQLSSPVSAFSERVTAESRGLIKEGNESKQHRRDTHRTEDLWRICCSPHVLHDGLVSSQGCCSLDQHCRIHPGVTGCCYVKEKMFFKTFLRAKYGKPWVLDIPMAFVLFCYSLMQLNSAHLL